MKSQTMELLVLVLMLLVSGLAAASAGTLDGAGTWQSQRLEAHGTWRADFVREGNDVSGGITVAGSPIASGGSIAGMITDSDTITFGVLENSERVATFTGTIHDDRVSGTYRAASGDEGTWDGTLTAHDK